jgi:hypothetical protein
LVPEVHRRRSVWFNRISVGRYPNAQNAAVWSRRTLTRAVLFGGGPHTAVTAGDDTALSRPGPNRVQAATVSQAPG